MGSIIGYIDITDQMHIELDIEIHSFPSHWGNIIHCTTDSDDSRLPGIWIHSTSETMGFYPTFSNDGDQDYGAFTEDSLEIGETYHLEMDITQSTHKVTVNGEVKAFDMVSRHQLYEDILCYASDPWYDAANVTISNLIIASRRMFFCDIFA